MNQPHRLVKPVGAPSKVRLAAAISAILTSAAPLLASVASAADVGDVSDIGEIVVTATRRSESVSDVPYNISAVTGADIVNSGVTDLVDLARVVPAWSRRISGRGRATPMGPSRYAGSMRAA